MSRSSPSLRKVLMTTRPPERVLRHRKATPKPPAPRMRLRLELLRREGREAGRVQVAASLSAAEGVGPGPAFQGGEVGVVGRLGAGRRRRGPSRPARGSRCSADSNSPATTSSLPTALSSAGISPALVGRQRAIASHQILDQPPLLLVAHRQAVAAVQRAFVELMLLQGAEDGVAQLLHLLALALHLRLDVEHVVARLHDDGMNVGEHRLQPLAVLVEGLGEGGEAGRLPLGKAFQPGVGQSLEQLAGRSRPRAGRSSGRRPPGRADPRRAAVRGTSASAS